MERFCYRIMNKRCKDSEDSAKSHSEYGTHNNLFAFRQDYGR